LELVTSPLLFIPGPIFAPAEGAGAALAGGLAGLAGASVLDIPDWHPDMAATNASTSNTKPA
jgi:hypothetical protein